MKDPDSDPTPPVDPVPEDAPAPSRTSELAEILGFMGECRRLGYVVVGRLRYRDLDIQLADLRPRPGYAGPGGTIEEDADPFEENGHDPKYRGRG